MPPAGGGQGSCKASVLGVTTVAAAVVLAAGCVYTIVKKRRECKPGKPQNLVWNQPLSELPTDKAVPIVDGAYLLGEGLVWCVRRQELWWVDINGMKIMRLTQAADGSLQAEGWETPFRPGSLAVRTEGGREPDCPLLVAFEDAFSLYNPGTGKRVSAAGPHELDEYHQLPNTRLNDGRCDRQGRFICGGLNMENIDQTADVWKPRAGVFRVESGKGVLRILLDEQFRCYNATCFTEDGSTMYCSDSPLKKISCYDYDTETGVVSNKRVFVDLKDDIPDGATVDTEGCVWVALYGSGQVRRYDAAGNLLRAIEIPGAKLTTCVAIGGPNLDILFVTSACVGLSDQQRVEQPNAGAIFAIRLDGVKGLPEPYYVG